MIDLFSNNVIQQKNMSLIKNMTSVITITDFPNDDVNDVVGMALRNDFYFSQIWSFVKRTYPPQQLAQLKKRGYSNERIDKEFDKGSKNKYKHFGWVCNKLMIHDILVGFTIWDYPLPTEDHPSPDKCCLEFMFVDPKYRGNGFGNMLVAQFKIQASLYKKTLCKIQVLTHKERLHKFYQDWGWEHGEPESPIDPSYIEMFCVLTPMEKVDLKNKRFIQVREIGEVY